MNVSISYLAGHQVGVCVYFLYIGTYTYTQLNQMLVNYSTSFISIIKLEKVSKFGNFRANLVDFGLRGKPLNDK